jgi:hypothetical protein
VKDDLRTLSDLRLVSRTFNELATPILFSSFTFIPSEDTLELCHVISSDLSEQNTHVFANTKHLCLKMSFPPSPRHLQYLATQWFELWNRMLPTMMNLRTLE